MSLQRWATAWCIRTMGHDCVNNIHERALRFLEESIEFIQEILTKEQVLKIVEHVYRKPSSRPKDEIGGVMVTLSVLATRLDLDIEEEWLKGINYCENNTDKIRMKHLQKVKEGTAVA